MSALQALHVTRRSAGLADEDFRAMALRVVGKESTREMTDSERQKVRAAIIKDYPAAGEYKKTAKGLAGPYAKKLQALWIAGWNLGLIRDKSDKALLSFVKRQTGLDHTRFLYHSDDAKKAIEALKGWLAREAGVDWSTWSGMRPWRKLSGARIAFAQYHILEKRKQVAPQYEQTFMQRAREAGLVINGSFDDLTEAAWIPVMNHFGACIRPARERK